MYTHTHTHTKSPSNIYTHNMYTCTCTIHNACIDHMLGSHMKKHFATSRWLYPPTESHQIQPLSMLDSWNVTHTRIRNLMEVFHHQKAWPTPSDSGSSRRRSRIVTVRLLRRHHSPCQSRPQLRWPTCLWCGEQRWSASCCWPACVLFMGVCACLHIFE
jgi:hypothetical protein